MGHLFSSHTQFSPDGNTCLFFLLGARALDRHPSAILASHLTTPMNGRHEAKQCPQEPELPLLAKQQQQHNFLPIPASFLTPARKGGTICAGGEAGRSPVQAQAESGLGSRPGTEQGKRVPTDTWCLQFTEVPTEA